MNSDTGLKNNPYIAPKDGRCLINTILPTELLSYIFELGTFWGEDIDLDLDLGSDSTGDDHEGENTDEDNEGTIWSGSGGSEDGWHTEESEKSVPEHSDAGQADEQDHERDLEFQVLVSHVCKHWREVALGNPSLWSTINFEYQGSHSFEKHATYLERAKNAPLMITVDCTIEGEDHPELDYALSRTETARDEHVYVELKRFLELVQPHVSHWREIEVMVAHYLLMQLTLETFASCSSAPILEALRLYFYEDSGEQTVFEPAHYRQQDFILFHGDAPRLARVALWGVHLDWSRSTFLSGLVELELAYHAMDVRPSYREFLRMLRASPELQHLSLCQSGPAGMPVDWLDSVSEDKAAVEASIVAGDSPLAITLFIPDLVLAFLPPDYLIALLNRILLPEVTSLTLDFEDDDYTDFLTYISCPAPMSTRSLLAGLEFLKVSGLPTRGIAVVSKALSEMQNLHLITINFNHVDLLWYELLSRPDEVESNSATKKTVYCPRLEEIAVSGLDGRKLRHLVQERIARGYPLKKVAVDEADYLDDEDQSWLEKHLEKLDFFEGSDDEEEEDVIEIDMDDDDDDDMGGFYDEGDYEEDDWFGGEEDDEWTDED